MSKYTKQYLDTITRLFNTIENEEQEAIDRTAVVIAESIMKDLLIHVVGTGGHSNIAAKAAVEAKCHHEKDNLWQSFKFRRFKPRSDDEHNPDWHLEWN